MTVNKIGKTSGIQPNLRPHLKSLACCYMVDPFRSIVTQFFSGESWPSIGEDSSRVRFYETDFTHARFESEAIWSSRNDCVDYHLAPNGRASRACYLTLPAGFFFPRFMFSGLNAELTTGRWAASFCLTELWIGFPATFSNSFGSRRWSYSSSPPSA